MNDMCTDCDEDFLCFKSTAGGLRGGGRPRGSWQQTVSRYEKSTCPVGHVSSRVHVPGRKIYVPRALGHALMSSPGHATQLNSLVPWRSRCDFKNTIFYLVLLIHIFNDNAFRWMPDDLTDDKLKLVQPMAWCHQAASHYLGQCWLRSMLPYGVIRPQWIIVTRVWMRCLTLGGLNKMSNILEIPFSNTFYLMNSFEYLIEFHCT